MNLYFKVKRLDQAKAPIIAFNILIIEVKIFFEKIR